MFPILKSKVILAPMAGFSDIAFRLLCKRAGAGLVVTEMISAEAIVRNNEKTLKLMRIEDDERPIAVQLFGNDPDLVANAAKKVEKYADILDFNMGCPMFKIMKQGSGSALLGDLKKAEDIITAMVDAVKKPVTVKIRSGINKPDAAIKAAKMIEKSGAAAIAVHARTAAQKYSGRADWDVIKNIKSAISIPVIGNGDIRTPEDAKRLFDQTDCNFVMVGRGVLGNPLLFRQINEYLGIDSYNQISMEQKLKQGLEYLKLAQEYDISIKSMRMQAQYFTKGLKGGAEVRRKIAAARNYHALVERVKSALS